MLPEATQSKNLIHPTRHDPEEIGKVFPQIVKKCVSLPTGTIHVLLGSDNIQLMPRELERRDRLILYKSMFSGGPDLVVAGLTGIQHLLSLHLPLKCLISPLSTFCWQRLSALTYPGSAEPARHVKSANSGQICSRQRRMLRMKLFVRI